MSPFLERTEHCFQDLTKDGNDLSPQPLVPLPQVEHLVHEQEDDPERDVVDGAVRISGIVQDPGANLALCDQIGYAAIRFGWLGGGENKKNNKDKTYSQPPPVIMKEKKI